MDRRNEAGSSGDDEQANGLSTDMVSICVECRQNEHSGRYFHQKKEHNAGRGDAVSHLNDYRGDRIPFCRPEALESDSSSRRVEDVRKEYPTTEPPVGRQVSIQNRSQDESGDTDRHHDSNNIPDENTQLECLSREETYSPDGGSREDTADSSLRRSLGGRCPPRTPRPGLLVRLVRRGRPAGR